MKLSEKGEVMKFIISEHIIYIRIYTSETVLYVRIGLYSAILVQFFIHRCI